MFTGRVEAVGRSTVLWVGYILVSHIETFSLLPIPIKLWLVALHSAFVHPNFFWWEF
jgi:hypothetical protein